MILLYDEWLDSLNLPVHTGYFIEDLRVVDAAWWGETGCDVAFLQLAGQEGVAEARVSQIRPGASTARWKLAVDELVYVVDGRGIATVWDGDCTTGKTFEWQKHSLFLLPGHRYRQLSNAQGDRVARLLHYNYLPLAMEAVGDPEFFFNNPHTESPGGLEAIYAEAKTVRADAVDHVAWASRGENLNLWYGAFFPDMKAWDKLRPVRARGAGGRSVIMQFPGSPISAHMSVFPPATYKKAHRHGPGFVIVIPAGEGYSIMWQEGQEKVVVPWHEGSLFVPPDRWFHQHFNVGRTAARYLALHPPLRYQRRSENVEDRARDTIEYTAEEPWIRQKFEQELGRNGVVSRMPADAYKDPGYQWAYAEDSA